jgi:DNA invertase Pin-like site-specific DNA recombinase
LTYLIDDGKKESGLWGILEKSTQTGVQTMANVAYLRVSTMDQNTAKNRADVLAFANDRDFGKVEFVEERVSGRKSWKERRIKEVIDRLSEGDRLLVPELTRLGRSTLDVLDILKAAKEKGLHVYSVKERLEMDDSMQSKVMGTFLALFAEIERDFISQRTKEALKARQAAGVKLGRPKGPGKSKLDPHKDEIIALIKTGVPKTRVAKKYGATVPTLHHWLKKRNIKVQSEI